MMSHAAKWMIVCMLSRIRLCVILWTVASQIPLSMGFSRQEHWTGLLCPLLGDLPNEGIETLSLMSLALAGRFFTTSATMEAPISEVIQLSSV